MVFPALTIKTHFVVEIPIRLVQRDVAVLVIASLDYDFGAGGWVFRGSRGGGHAGTHCVWLFGWWLFFFFYVSDVVVVVVRKDFGASGSLDMGIVRGLGSLMAVYGGEEEVFGFWRLVRYVV